MKNQHTARREQLSYDIEVEVQRTALEAHSNIRIKTCISSTEPTEGTTTARIEIREEGASRPTE